MTQLTKLTKPILLTLILSVVTITLTNGHTVARGSSCDNNAGDGRVSPKFKSSHQTCDETKGLSCVDSENPEFVSGGNGTQICDCTEEFYFDPVSEECRIQIGFRCDPEVVTEDEGVLWNDKCPENGFCSRNVGRYGPKGARGMCRCREGYTVVSVWFVGGGGTICEKEEEALFKNEALGLDYEFQEMNGLIIA